MEHDGVVCELVPELVAELELGSVEADEDMVDMLLTEVLLTGAAD
jgi:hypothetical protein